MELTTRQNLRLVALAIVGPVAALLMGQFATFPNLAPWYAELIKPTFNPPNWVFGPVWTALYALMVFAVWRILRLPSKSAGRSRALVLFFVQLVLNGAWSWMFFGSHSPMLGVINIVPQLALVAASIVAFYRLDKLAAWCLAPLAAWVAFAAALNVAIWQLNI